MNYFVATTDIKKQSNIHKLEINVVIKGIAKSNLVASSILYNHEWITTQKEDKIGEFEDGNLYFKISNCNSKYSSRIRRPEFDKVQRSRLKFSQIPQSG